MEQKKIYRSIAPIGMMLIILFVAACSAPALPSPTQTQTTNTQVPTEPPATPMSGAGLCANTYYPVRQGARWTYKSSGGPAGDYGFTDTITSVREDGFTLSTQIGDLTRTQEWTCEPGGLVALQLGGAPAAMLNSQNIQLNLDAKDSKGVTFPSQMNAGDGWQQSVEVEGDVSMGNDSGKAAGTAQMDFNALGTESVSVPAGTFEAMKVKVDTTLNVDVAYGALSMPVTFSGTYTYWFVQDVGWVKASGTGNLFGASFSETTELQSYQVP
jgi:uncharacterized protein DUF3108